MAERWLYGVDGGLTEPGPWEPDPWDDGVVPGRDLGSLTEIVVIDGQVVDSRRRPVSGSGYECVALELDHLRGPVQPRVERVVVREDPQEAMLHWLERVVGGAEPLERLDAQPLPADEELDVGGLPPSVVDVALVVDDLMTSAGPPPMLAGELLTAYRRLLALAGRSGMLRQWRDVEPERVAAAIVHCVVKANALTGAGAPFRVKDFIHGLGLQQAPYDRSRSLALVTGGTDWPHGRRPVEAPDVFVLGHEGLLVSRFRHDLLTYRDLARQARSAQEAGAAAG